MSKLSPKDWLRLLGIYGVLIALLVGIYFFFGALKSIFLSIPGLKDFFQNTIRAGLQFITPYIPNHIDYYFWILITLGVIYFFLEDLIKLFRGKRDQIEDKDLPLDEQVLKSLAHEYGEAEPRTLGIQNSISVSERESAPTRFDREFSYSPLIHFWIIGILLFGLCYVWVMAILYPKEMTGLFPITLTLSGISLYLFYLARRATRKIYLDSQHIWMGKNKNNLYREKNYASVYYTHFLVRRFISVEKHYSLLVFRKGFSFPPFHWFIDRFFPASNSKRQVIFLNIWKDENKEYVQPNALVKRIFEDCERNGIKIKHWTCEAQFFLICIFLALLFMGWIHLR